MSIDLKAPVNTLFNADSKLSASYDVKDKTSANYAVVGDSANMLVDKLNAIGDYNGVPKTGTASNTIGNLSTNYLGYYWNWYEPYKEYHYHNCHVIAQPDKFETAFKLARKLMEKKMTKPHKTIEDFFQLMDVIVATL